MTILTRFGALTALSALAACGTATTTPGTTSNVDVSGMLAKAGAYDQVTTDDHTNMNTAIRDAALGGVTGFMGFEDGTVKPIRVRVSADSTSAFLSIDGGEEIEFDVASAWYSQSRWSNDDGRIGVYLNDYAYAQSIRLEESENDGQGHFGIQSTPEDLANTNGIYAGNYYMLGVGYDSSSGEIALRVNFAEGSVTGSLVGDLYLPSEFVPEEEYDYYDGYYQNGIYGEIEGGVEDGVLAASVDVVGLERDDYDDPYREVTGSLELMGGFYNDGTSVAGGIGGTISETEMGGEFNVSSGYYR